MIKLSRDPAFVTMLAPGIRKMMVRGDSDQEIVQAIAEIFGREAALTIETALGDLVGIKDDWEPDPDREMVLMELLDNDDNDEAN